MSCEVAALPFQALANYGTWSIDFAEIIILSCQFKFTVDIREKRSAVISKENESLNYKKG